jgi:hypothetical protein
MKQMPELGSMPTQPKPSDTNQPPNETLAVVLEAIKQKAQAQPETQALEQALHEAQKLAASQA